MLVLSRKLNETIVIGGFTVTVVGIRGDKVRLGVVAPKDVIVDRQEVHDRRKAAAEVQQNSPPTPVS